MNLVEQLERVSQRLQTTDPDTPCVTGEPHPEVECLTRIELHLLAELTGPNPR